VSTTKSARGWKEKLLACQASGKSVRVWCSEHQVPVSTFYGWKKRLKKLSDQCQQITPKQAFQQIVPRGFIELTDKKPSETGIIIEYDGIKIHLLSAFDPSALKQCLSCLRGAAC
jgi:hypothetical protein